jgi:amino acid transporter
MLLEFVTSIGAIITSQAAVMIFVCLFAFILLWKVIDSDNPLEWWHFISSRGPDGKEYADIDKLGKVVGIIISSVAMLIITHQGKMDAVILGVYLAFVGGVAGYSAYLRSKQWLPPAKDGEK